MQLPAAALSAARIRQRGVVVTVSRAGHAVRVGADGDVRRGPMEPERRAPIIRPAGTQVA